MTSRELGEMLVKHLNEQQDFEGMRLVVAFCEQLSKEMIQQHAMLRARRLVLERIASMN